MKRLERCFAWFIALIAVFGTPLIGTTFLILAPDRYTMLVAALVSIWLWLRAYREVSTMRVFVRRMERL